MARGTRTSRPASASRRLATALAPLLVLLGPASALGSGVVSFPIGPPAAVRLASAVVLGTTLGTRDVRVSVPIGETPLAPEGRTAVEFTVRQVGLRVEAVLGKETRGRVKVGAELWLTDPGEYERGRLGELAAVATVGEQRYAPRQPFDAGKAGRRAIAFAETSADRAARGRPTAGLADAWWQVAAGAFDSPARRAEVERLCRASRGGPAPAPAR